MITETNQQPINCLVLEDNPESQSMIIDILVKNFAKIIPHGSSNLKEAKDLFNVIRPELMILDINLPDGNSIEFLTEIDPVNLKDTKIIFTTAFAKYAIEAFKFSALDYLLKPYTPNELIESIKNALHIYNKNTYQQQLEAFFFNNQGIENNNKKLVLKSVDTMLVVRIQEIYQAVSHSNYTVFHLTNAKPVMVSQTLKEFDFKLKHEGFLRIHQSHLVNVNYIKSFQRRDNSIILENNAIVPVSQNRKSDVINYLNSL